MRLALGTAPKEVADSKESPTRQQVPCQDERSLTLCFLAQERCPENDRKNDHGYSDAGPCYLGLGAPTANPVRIFELDALAVELKPSLIVFVRDLKRLAGDFGLGFTAGDTLLLQV